MNPNKLKAVLIDLDGTIVDSMPFLYQIYCEFMTRLGLKGTKKEFDELSGPSLREAIVLLKSRYNIEEDAEHLCLDYEESLYTHYTKNLKLFSGVRPFLEYAKKRGLKLGLVTSANERLAKGFLASEELEQEFDQVITPKGLAKGKPDPEIYRRALESLNLHPEEVVAVEDSKNGLLAASSAEIYTMHIVHNGNSAEGLGLTPSLQVKDWHEILNIFQGWYE